MPKHPDFKKIYHSFLKRYCSSIDQECQKGRQMYYAWLNKMDLDDTKPYGRQQESFRWARQLFQLAREDEDTRYYRVEALFPVCSMNGNLYTEEELEKAARTLRGKPVNLNHQHPLDGVEIVDAEYEDGAVESVLAINKTAAWNDKPLADMIDQEEILHVSIEATCRHRKVTPDGATCEGLTFTGLALLTKDTLPGVPLTRLMPLETLLETTREQGGRDACYLCGRKVGDYVLLAGQKVHIQCAVNFWQLALKTFHFNEKEKKEMKKPTKTKPEEKKEEKMKPDTEQAENLSDPKSHDTSDQNSSDQQPPVETEENTQEKERMKERLENLEAEIRALERSMEALQTLMAFSGPDGNWQTTENTANPPQENHEDPQKESVGEDDSKEEPLVEPKNEGEEENFCVFNDCKEKSVICLPLCRDCSNLLVESMEEPHEMEARGQCGICEAETTVCWHLCPEHAQKLLQNTPQTEDCVLTRKGFWNRFHQLRDEGLSRSDAFRVVSTEVIEAASK